MSGSGGSRRTRARVVVGAGALVIVGATASACSAKHDPAPGEILLAIDTNLRVSGDVDTIGLSVSEADGTHVSEDAMFPLAPVGNAMFPATLAIIRGTTQPIKIRVVGYQQGNPISLRDTITTIPADRTALLRTDINWLDEGAVMTVAAETSVSSLTSGLCPAGQTSIGGGCSSFTLDSATLPDFDAGADLTASNGPQCFDVLACFGGSGLTTVPRPPASDCTLAVPAAASGDNVNIGLNVAPGHGGWCGASGCVVPLERDPAEGWSLTPGGKLQLPPGACTNPLVESIAVLVNDCETYTPAHPACEVYGDAGATTMPPSGDATVPQDGAVEAGGDATMTSPDGAPLPDGGVADAGVDSAVPDMPYTYSPTSGVVTFAVSETRLYVLTSKSLNGVAFYLLQTFPRGQPGSPSTPVPFAYEPPTAAEMVASGSVLAFTNNDVTRTTVVNMLNVADDGTFVDAGVITALGSASTFASLGIQGLAGGGTRVFTASLTTSNRFCWRDVGGAEACTTGTDGLFYNAAVDPTSGMYALAKHGMGFTGAPLQPLEYGAFDPTAIDGGAFAVAEILPSTPQTIEGFGFADPQHVAWLDSAGNVWITPTTTDSSAATSLATGAAPNANQLSTGSNRVAWLDQESLTVRLVELDAGVPGPVQNFDPTMTALNQVVISGADLFWTDGVQIFSKPF